MIVRSAIICLIVSALMQPVLYRLSAHVSVVYVLDVSQSVSSNAIKKAIEWIERTNDAGKPDHSSFVAFAENAEDFSTIEDLKRVQVSNWGAKGILDQTSTDVSNALDRALLGLRPNYLKRIVLLSDGNDNRGDLDATLVKLNREKAHVYALPLDVRLGRDAWVDAIRVPSAVTAHEEFSMEVSVYSQFATIATVKIRKGNELLGSKSVQLVTGPNRIAFDTRLPDESATVVITGHVEAPEDAVPENNTFRQPVVVQGRPRLLYIESHAPSAAYLQKALTTEGLVVDVKGAAGLPATVGALDAYDAVILSDVDPKSLSALQMDAIETYVRDLGGGFILAGGENTYGKDGYSNSPIEKTLPVTFDTKKRPPTIAMVAVIDVSGSMSQGQLEVAKEAAKAPLMSLRDSDRFGVLSFNTAADWVAPLQPARGRNEINSQIETLYAGGGTNIYVGLDAAFGALNEAPDDVKTVILLSDGITQAADHMGLTTAMRKAGINVSSISVGQRSNRELMADIAMWGRGRSYYIDSYDRVPQLFVKETELALGKTLQEQPFSAIVSKNVEAFKGIDFKAAPPLLGYVVTKAKPTAETLLTESWTNEPLLVRWQYGLGRTAAFTSDVKTRWAPEWIEWKDYPKFWSQLVRETMRRRSDEEFDFAVERKKDFAVVSVNTVGKDGRFLNNLKPKVRVIAPDQKVSTLDILQIAPGAYETQVKLDKDGPYVFRAVSASGNGPTRVLEYSYPPEYHFYPTDIQKLQYISAATGGSFDPREPDIFDTRGETVEFPTELWPIISSVVLALYFLDILLRRVRLFRHANPKTKRT
jgi:uncharacterized membrane protein